MVTGPPSAIPVANPADVLDVIEESEMLQTTDDVMSFPKLSIAVNCVPHEKTPVVLRAGTS